MALPSRRGIDMSPTADDELNAAWAEVNKARAERDRYREALERIGVACDNGSQPMDKLTFIRRVTRGALDA